MNNINTPAENIIATQPELTEGLFVLELEERLELAAVAAAAGCERCDADL